MKAILICPGDRPLIGHLASRAPLAIAPLLGRSPLEFWIEALAAQGARELLVLAHDRPGRVRELVGDGRRWGVQITVVPTAGELTPEEARTRFKRGDPAQWLVPNDTVVIDHLPEQPELPLFDSYQAWFAAAQSWIARAASPHRIGLRQIMPGIWAGLRAEIDASVRLTAPCWIGDYVRIGADAQVGPGAVIEDRCVIEAGAKVTGSIVGPDTYVGRYVSVASSLARGDLLVNWKTNSSVRVPDPFLLSDLSASKRGVQRPNFLGRAAALVAMILTAPFAIVAILLSLARGDVPWQLRLGLRSQPGRGFATRDTFAYYELTGARNWLRRWPQFWSVLRGDLVWVGNRPLRPTQALLLGSDFERLWLAAPIGLISLADAHGCPEGVSDDAIAHASYFAVQSERGLKGFILSRALVRAACAWPIRGRRRDATVPLQELVPKQEI